MLFPAFKNARQQLKSKNPLILSSIGYPQNLSESTYHNFRYNIHLDELNIAIIIYGTASVI
jgi:hypothetical protein